MGEYQPLIGFMNKIVRNNTGHILFRFKPGRGDPNVVRQIAAHLFSQGLDDRLNAAAAVEYVVHDEKPVFPVGMLDNVLQSMDTDLFISFVDTVVRRGPDSNVIGFYT